MKIRTYDELCKFKTYLERFNYLKLSGTVGDITFGHDRYLNQILYTSRRWLKTRDEIIIRDNANDFGLEDHPIQGRIIVHHMNPITLEDIELERDIVFDPRYLISTSLNSHNAVHYGDERLLGTPLIERKPNDTIPWKG